MTDAAFTDLLSAIIDNRGRTAPTAESGVPLIATNCIKDDALYPVREKVRYVDDETYRTWFRGHPEPGDILFVCKGSPGRTALVPDPVDFVVAQDMVAVRADETKIYPRFLLAALRSPGVRGQVENMHVGSLIPHFKKGDFDKLRIPTPDRTVQEAVGDLYFAISEKIESNRRIVHQSAALLDAMAEAHCSSISTTPLGSLSGLTRETVSPAALGDAVVDHYSLPAFDASGRPERGPASAIMSNKIRIPGTSLLVSRLNPRTKRTWWAAPVAERSALASTEFAVLSAPNEIELASIWLAVRHPLFLEELPRRVTGTSGSHQRVRPQDMLAIEVPDVRQLNVATKESALVLLRLAHQRREESARLSGLRDTLMPELLAGRIRVPEAASVVQDVTE